MSGKISIKYVLCPGVFPSRTDNQRHYIGASRLAMLYGVPMCECLVHEPASWWPEHLYRMAEARHQGLIKLYPDYSGKYVLPTT